MGRNIFTSQPPRSPDLTPIDLRNTVYGVIRCGKGSKYFKCRIVAATVIITSEILEMSGGEDIM
jgi:hypothetical protein